MILAPDLHHLLDDWRRRLAASLGRAIDAYSVDATERMLEETGFLAPRQASAPAVAFIDLTGFSRLAKEQGDEAAASMAMRLATLAEAAAGRHRGRRVTLLGDGVLLRFEGPGAAVDASFELLDGLGLGGLPGGVYQAQPLQDDGRHE